MVAIWQILINQLNSSRVSLTAGMASLGTPQRLVWYVAQPAKLPLCPRRLIHPAGELSISVTACQQIKKILTANNGTTGSTTSDLYQSSFLRPNLQSARRSRHMLRAILASLLLWWIIVINTDIHAQNNRLLQIPMHPMMPYQVQMTTPGYLAK